MMKSTYPKTYQLRATQPSAGLAGGRQYRIVAVKASDTTGQIGIATPRYAAVTVYDDKRIAVESPLRPMTPIMAAALGDCLVEARRRIAESSRIG